jgi:histone chaperone ASF1
LLQERLTPRISQHPPNSTQADPPDAAKLPPGDVVGVTALLLTCSYQGKEFLRVGYYVNVEYWDEALREAPPERPVVER